MKAYRKAGIAGMLAILLFGAGLTQAGTDLNEVGAFLVYPLVAGFSFSTDAAEVDGGTGGSYVDVETFLTITNTSTTRDIVAHISYINGDEYDYYECYECDFDLPLTPTDTEVLVVTYGEFGTTIESEDRTVSRACPHKFGFVVASVEIDGETVGENILLGSEVVVEYGSAAALSIPAIPFQSDTGTSPERIYEFGDGREYKGFPRVVAADFLAPNHPDWYTDGRLNAALALFTLDFERQFPPLVDCSVTGYDAAEHKFSRSLQFGCWTFADLCDIDPEFCYPNLSAAPCDPYETDLDDPFCHTHGWLQLNCKVRRNGADPASPFVNGGVHGALVQVAENATIRRNDPYAPQLYGWAAWARLLYQSRSNGDPISLELEGTPPGLD
jgi:hypothetical protein